MRGERVRRLSEIAEVRTGLSFGDEGFLELLGSGAFDCLAHHAANVTNYKSLDFDVTAALADNTRNLSAVLRLFAERGGRAVVLTGSVFEQGEGAGNEPMRAFSPYGLSKGLTAEVFDYWTTLLGLRMGKFVIPNPFGPLEEPRFCSYLIRCWTKGEAASVQTPRYVRDNIHVGLLAKAYAAFCEETLLARADTRLNPSGYVETQGAFAERFAREIGPRLGLGAEVVLKDQTVFDEPLMRVNTQPLDTAALGWNETAAWDEAADFYR
ncbi:NAD-dependent epimerase/dehydratase family protein [Fulvimarina endophytica]|uniref:NAD-dependent epimerase/dehydratase family protein n=1 Tax=Fulvimarina endophytica TaxID=2293836 RepID=A0A371X3C4_9HYPH|nr:NAD-dependent epimerase/dehydratase family protein [Fulvimarina endophytica]RFC63725.1 NAD-dependent epimerase/dehydratase family protein [Fulvimarina endophytica]